MLSDDALQAFLSLGVRGYTIRRIRELMEAKGHSIGHCPDAALLEILLQSKDQLEVARQDLDARTRFRYGLSDRMERVRRLAEAAERIEKLVGQDPRWLAEYRRLLSTIRSEMEPLGIEIRPGDEWADLLAQLMEASGTDVEEGNDEPEATDHPEAGDTDVSRPVAGSAG